MADDMDKEKWEKLLKEVVFCRTGKGRNVQLPAETDIKISGNLAEARITLTNNATTGHMLEDRSAVEGWALVLMSWCGVQNVVISWSKPPRDTEGKLHYQRFLYRMRRFWTLFEGRVKVADPGRLDDLSLAAQVQ
jgi:hypothetical protein